VQASNAELLLKIDTLSRSIINGLTTTEFDNWRLRFQWENRTKDIIVPEIRR
jgi:hypothetical protein